jgi:hypothetical protein
MIWTGHDSTGYTGGLDDAMWVGPLRGRCIYISKSNLVTIFVKLKFNFNGSRSELFKKKKST